MADRQRPDLPPPDGYNTDAWDKVCRTEFSDQLRMRIAQELAAPEGGQDIDPAALSAALGVAYKPTVHVDEGAGNDVFYEIVGLWQGNEMRYLSEFVSALSNLERPVLVPRDVIEWASEGYDQGTNWEWEEPEPQPLHTQDSGLCLHEVYPTICTEAHMEQFMVPMEEERKTLNFLTNINKELVIGTLSTNRQAPLPETDEEKRRMKALREKLRSLQRRFCVLLNHVYDMLKQKEVAIEKLRQYLTQRCADEHGEIPLFPKLMTGILKRASLHEVFVHLSRIGAWYFLNYLFMEELVEDFKIHDSETARKLEEYRCDVNEFKNSTLLLDFLAVWGGRCDDDDSFPGYRTVIARSIHDPKSFTIADACDQANFISSQFSLKNLSQVMRLASGTIGSVYIRWLVPAPATKHMLKVMESKERPNLLKFGIVQLAIERKIFQFEGSYENLHKLSVASPRWFWGVAARELEWMKPSKEVFTHDTKTGEFHWFRDAELNVSVTCLDACVEKHPDKVALIWEKDNESQTEGSVRVTYSELLEQTCQVANVLKQKGSVRKGDVVVICMPTMPLAVACMLACARIGAIHCVLFPDFNAEVLKDRIDEVKAKAVITADVRIIGGKTHPLKGKVLEAVKENTQVQFVLVANRSGKPAEKDTQSQSNDKLCLYLEKEMEEVPSECEPEPMAGEDTLFIAYTSGTQTGSKRIHHRQAGYLLYTKLTFKFMFNPEPNAIIGCVSDLAWLAAHSYVVYGPLSNGNTTVLFESVANHPNEGRYWRMVDKLKVTHFYTVPSVLKELMIKEKELAKERYDVTKKRDDLEIETKELMKERDNLLAKKELREAEFKKLVEKEGTEAVLKEQVEVMINGLEKKEKELKEKEQVLKDLQEKGKELEVKEKARSVEHHNLSSLKVIASGGEPVPVDIQRWYCESVGKNNCLFLDTWGQTELGGTGIVRWEAPEGKERVDFPRAKAFALFGVDLGELNKGNSELFLKLPLPGMGKNIKIDHQDGYCTGDILECTDPKAQVFRVTERREKALLIQGGWYSTTAIEDSLRMMYSGICDAQIITCEGSDNKPESLFVVLQTGEKYKEKDMASFYSIAKIGQNEVSKAGPGLKIKVFFLECCDNLKKCFETAGRKRTNSVLKEYLKKIVNKEKDVKLSKIAKDGRTAKWKWDIIDPEDLLKHCSKYNPMAPPIHVY